MSDNIEKRAGCFVVKRKRRIKNMSDINDNQNFENFPVKNKIIQNPLRINK